MLILAENFNENELRLIEKNKDDVVCLTPIAADIMTKRGLYYKTPDDFYVWDEDEHYKFLINRLMKSIDNFFEEKIGTTCLFMIKNLVDPFIEKTKTFEYIVAQDFYFKCVFLRYRKDDIIDNDLYFKGESLYSRIYKYWPKNENNSYMVTIPYKRKKHYKDNNILRMFYRLKKRFESERTYLKNLKVVCISNMAMNKEAKTFIRQGIPIMFLPDLYRYPLRTWDFYIPNLMMRDIAEYLGMNVKFVANIISKRLYYFFNAIAPTILDLIPKYKKYFEEKNISCIIFDRRNKLYHHSALLAAKQMNISTIYVRHGWDAYDFDERYITRILPFDYYISADEIEKEKIIEKKFENCVII